jgi:hypothetical protein
MKVWIRFVTPLGLVCCLKESRRPSSRSLPCLAEFLWSQTTVLWPAPPVWGTTVTCCGRLRANLHSNAMWRVSCWPTYLSVSFHPMGRERQHFAPTCHLCVSSDFQCDTIQSRQRDRTCYLIV